MTIGVLAKKAGIGVETVRYYHRIGLLDEPPRPQRGFRQYDNESLLRLQFIRKVRRLGFNLEETRELSSLVQMSPSDSTLAKHYLARVRARVLELQELERLLTAQTG